MKTSRQPNRVLPQTGTPTTRRGVRAVVLLAGALVLQFLAPGCSGGGGSIDPALDSDGDGLSDQAEIQTHGTSPILADTDGDGFSDYTECIEYGFDPDNDPVKFNPCVADVPTLGLHLTSPPDVALELGETSSTTRVFETSRSNENATTVAQSTTDTNSHAVEMSHTATVEVGFSGWTPEGSVSYSFSHSTREETSHSYTQEQSEENRQTLESAEAFEQATSVGASGGILMMTAEIENRSNMSFRVDNLILGATVPNLFNPGEFTPVGNLVLDTSGDYTDFPEVTIGPGGKTGVLNFINDGLDLETAKGLLRDTRGLVIQPALYELTDTEGRSFAFNLTDISTRTATVIIDYAGYRAPERFMVATNADPAQPGISVEKAIKDYLRIPYSAGITIWDGTTRHGLVRLQEGTNCAVDEQRGAYWLVVHNRQVGHDRIAVPYDLLVEDYDFDGIQLRAGDVLHLVYVEDQDGDRIYAREEFLRGCSDELLDSDGDGLSDAEEIQPPATDPSVVDTDGDNLNDLIDPDPCTPNRVMVAAGGDSSYAIKTDGSLWAWGDNYHGQLGLGYTGGFASTPQQVQWMGWVEVGAGQRHAVALRDDGTLWAWGNNDNGQLGNPDYPGGSSIPVQIGNDYDWIDVEAALEGGLARKSDGTLWTWGDNSYGQLGLGDTNDRPVPSLVEGPDARWLQVTSTRSTLGIRTDGTVWAWGWNWSGQLGLGDEVNRSVPTQVEGLESWAQVVCHQHHSLGIGLDGMLWTWGDNSIGQLGDGSSQSRSEPGALGTGWKHVFGGTQYGEGGSSLAIATDGTLWAWGCNWDGQLGLGDSTDRLQPTQVGSGEEWVAGENGYGHALALQQDGTVWAWGENGSGQLGDGTATWQQTPVSIMSLIHQ